MSPYSLGREGGGGKYISGGGDPIVFFESIFLNNAADGRKLVLGWMP